MTDNDAELLQLLFDRHVRGTAIKKVKLVKDGLLNRHELRMDLEDGRQFALMFEPEEQKKLCKSIESKPQTSEAIKTWLSTLPKPDRA